MKIIEKILVIIIILFFILGQKLPLSAEIDKTLENLDLSGFFRIRALYTGSTIKVPNKFAATDEYKSVDYQDLFLRARLYLKVLPNLQIRTVFDVVSVLGKGGFALGSGATDLITRDVYAVFRPSDNSEISAGLKPFSLPGGYILARDAAGIQYDQRFLRKKLRTYVAIVKAFDDADDAYGENSNPPKYSDDNVYIVGIDFNISSSLSSEIYYVYERDRYKTDEDNRESSLNWGGIHNKFVYGNFLLRLGGIYNWGFLYLKDENDEINRVYVNAGLLEFETGYRFSNLQLSLIAEGATGDPNNSNAGESFQDIKASHGFSFIVVDNSGGISIRGSGESSWYGLYGSGLKLQYTLLDSLLLELKLLHFRTTKELTRKDKSSTWLGDEFDFKAEYIYREALSIFLNAGVFRPEVAYTALEDVDHAPGGVILEFMLGAKITY